MTMRELKCTVTNKNIMAITRSRKAAQFPFLKKNYSNTIN